jgi:hypothetical protein
MKTYSIPEIYKINEVPHHHNDIGYTDSSQLEVYEFAKKIVIENGFNTIVDIGCGSGYKLVKLLGEFKTIGIETEPCISHLRQTYPERQWLDSGRPEESFCEKNTLDCDLIICSDVIEHIIDPDELLDYINTFCFKYALISTPCRDILCNSDRYSHIYSKSLYGPPLNPCHVREWTIKEFRTYLLSKFNVIESNYCKKQIECQYHLIQKKK